ncbi:MAG: Spy/CpxP family protein refolding chaperone, partial [Gracilimonas sp.]
LLNLSEEQLEQVQEHWLNGQKEMLPLRNQLQEKNARLQTLTTSANYDEKAVNALVKEIGDLQNQILAKRVAHRQEMRNLLTDEQRITFDSFQSRKGPGMRAGGRSGYNNFRGFRR